MLRDSAVSFRLMTGDFGTLLLILSIVMEMQKKPSPNLTLNGQEMTKLESGNAI